MEQMYRDPAYFSFDMLATKLGVDQYRLEVDFKTNKIKAFLIDNKHAKVSSDMTNRILSVINILNQYARDHLFAGPYKILTAKCTKKIRLTPSRMKVLLVNQRSDSIFKLWLNEFGIDIDNIDIVIPLKSAVKYENYLKGTQNSISDTSICSEDNINLDKTIIPINEVDISNEENEQFKLKKGVKKDSELESGPEKIIRVSPPDVTGRKGPIKTMILGGLQAYYEQYKRLPEEGNAFQKFLDFIYLQFIQKQRPDFLGQIDKIFKTGTETSNCITIKGGKKPKNRKYISTQFYKFKKDFTPEATSEPAQP